jgi:spermidine synthase
MQTRDPQVETFTSPFQRLDIVRFQNPKPYFQLFLNEDFQFDSEDHGLYHQVFLKGALHFKPSQAETRQILILGGGDGLLAAALFKDLGENIEITLVELDPKVTELAQEKWPDLTDRVFSKKIHLIYDDAFRFLRQHPNKYDAIFMDFPDPKSFDTSKLYSVEMYQMVRKVLKENGFITLDFPFANSQSVLVSTLDAAGFRNQVFFGQGHKFFYADALPERPEMHDLALKSPFPVHSPVTPDPHAVNSIFRPRLPESL